MNIFPKRSFLLHRQRFIRSLRDDPRQTIRRRCRHSNIFSFDTRGAYFLLVFLPAYIQLRSWRRETGRLWSLVLRLPPQDVTRFVRGKETPRTGGGSARKYPCLHTARNDTA